MSCAAPLQVNHNYPSGVSCLMSESQRVVEQTAQRLAEEVARHECTKDALARSDAHAEQLRRVLVRRERELASKERELHESCKDVGIWSQFTDLYGTGENGDVTIVRSAGDTFAVLVGPLVFRHVRAIEGFLQLFTANARFRLEFPTKRSEGELLLTLEEMPHERAEAALAAGEDMLESAIESLLDDQNWEPRTHVAVQQQAKQ
jgi:hypothetical protein